MTINVSPKDEEDFVNDVEAMREGLLPKYLANQGEPDTSAIDKTTASYWIMRLPTEAGVTVWRTSFGTFGHIPPARDVE